jgi:hypothetical protein
MPAGTRRSPIPTILVPRDSENGTLLSVYRMAKPGGDTRLIYFSLALDGKIGEFGTSPDRDYQ